MAVVSERLEPRVLFATLPADFSETVIVSTLNRPTAMALADDGRVFVSQQLGNLRLVKNGAIQPDPVLSVTVGNAAEQGLMGVALDPNFSENNFIYIFYSSPTPDGTQVNNRISRFTLDGDVAVPGSEKVLLTIFGVGIFHMSGGLCFGPDGKLYISSGDSSYRPNGQSLSTLKGKILRINPDGTIPTDNPFYNTLEGDLRAIWAYGVRNSFTIEVGRESGKVFINDVGSTLFEEINIGQPGGNYGWNDSEGPTTTPGHISPFYYYAGGPGGRNSAVIGGALYEGVPQQFPAQYDGKYFFTDHIRGWIKTLDPETGDVQDFGEGLINPVSIKLANDGTLYYLQQHDNSQRGRLVQIRHDAGAEETPPNITTQPEDSTVSVGKPVAFFVSASSSAPMTYQWQRNGVDIAGATGQTYEIPSASLADDGAMFSARVTNAFGSVTSNAATLTVTTNQSPTAQIDTPAAGTTYIAGQSFTFSGSGTDPETGALPGSSLSWHIEFHHDTHTHPFMAPTPGASGSFTIDASGETAPDVFYRIHLTVTDPAGLTATTFRDVVPIKTTLTLASNPAGINVKLDGQVKTEPVVGVVGVQRTLEAPLTADVGGVLYEFDKWSDGNTNAVRDLPFPGADTTLVAQYRNASTGEPPPPPPDPVGTIYEAEKGRVIGATRIRLKSRYTGDGFANLTDVGQAITWQVDAAKARTYALVFRYAQTEDAPLPVVVNVNGTVAAEANFKPTANRHLWRNGLIRVELPAGTSDVRLETTTTGALKVDSLRIARVVQEAETATLTGGAAATISPPAPGGNGLVELHTRRASSAPATIEWTTDAATDGTHELSLRYANGTGQTVTVQIADVATGETVTINLLPTAGWSELRFAKASINLTAGKHKLRLTSTLPSAVELDQLVVSPPVA